MNAMILAAGRGERLRPLTDELPKPLLPVAGRPLIAWHLQSLAAAGYQRVVINISWLGERIVDAIGDGRDYGVSIAYSDEGEVALETGGGIVRALPLLGKDPFLVMNGDIISGYPLPPPALQEKFLAHLVMVPNPAHNPHGDFALTGDRLKLHGERRTFSGIGLYRPELFSDCEDGPFPLAPLLSKAIASGRVSGELWHGAWYDVGTPQRYRAVRDLTGLCQDPERS